MTAADENHQNLSINLLSAAREVQKATDFHEALQIAVREMTKKSEGVYGEAWVISEKAEKPTFFSSGNFNEAPQKQFNNNALFPPHYREEFACKVWRSKETQWKSGISTDSATKTAGSKNVKFNTAIGVPVIARDRVTAIICFYLTENFNQKNLIRFEEMLATVTTHLENIFQQRLSDDALKKSQDKYRLLFDEDLSAIFIASPDGRITDCNPAYMQLFGFKSREKALDSSFNDRFTNNMHKVFFWEVLKRKGTISGHEMSALKTDGQTIYITLKIVAHYNQSGRLKEVVGYIQDITYRKSIEVALRKSDERYESLIETTNDWIWEINQQYRFTYSSFKIQTILGYDPQKIIGESLFNLMPQNEVKKVKRTFNELFKDQKSSVNIEHTCLTGEGNEVILDTSGIPLYDNNGIFHGYRGITRDITERKVSEMKIAHLNEELEHKVIERTKMLQVANKELEAFSYSVSHDLRAPLRSIDGFSQALIEDYNESLDDMAKNYLARVRSAAQRMSTLIDDMIKLSKVTRSSMTKKQVNLSSIAESVAAFLKEAEPDRNVEFVIEKNMMTTGDEALLKVVMQNLMENAWKFTSKKTNPRVEIGSDIIRGVRTYYVRDNGAGFNMDYAKKMYAPFQRLHKEKEFPGTGIGLSTVQRIIHRHLGRIWAEGKVNEGAVFYFTIQSEMTPE